jgi:Asp-tRNA(Asn)/Glu-tRNA(Gln) amidotransferase A subunit family amidase
MLNRSKTDAMTKLPSDLHWMSAWQIREAIVTRRLSATEVACHFIERIDALDRRLHSFFTVSGEVALDQARAIDRRIDRGEPVGPLAGVPVSIKDQFWTRGIRTTGGSRVYADHVPDEDSLHVARVKAADGLIIGKTSTPEFGMFWRTVGRIAPECVNPWDAKRTSGGSSGGAAASVAAGLGPLALGSDAGGSIRLPSAMCGVLGVLPSNGRVPRHGAFGSTLFFGRGANHARCGMPRRCCNCCAASAADLPAGPTSAGLSHRVRPRRRRAAAGLVGNRCHQQVRAGRRRCRRKESALGSRRLARGSTILTLDTAGIDEAWKVLDFVDCYAALGEKAYMDAALRRKLSPTPGFARRGQKVTGAKYSAVLRRAEFIRSIERAFENCDVPLAPTLDMSHP